MVKVASSGIRTSKPVCLVVRCEGGLTLHWACAYARAHRVTVLRITLEFAREIGLKTLPTLSILDVSCFLFLFHA